MEALSPELALVDAELAAAARAALAPAPDVFATLERVRANRDVVRRLRESFSVQEAVDEQAAVRRRPSRRLAGIAIATAVAAGASVAAALALGQDDVAAPRALASNAPSEVQRKPVAAPKPRQSIGVAVSQRPVAVAKPKAKPHAVAPKPQPKPAPKTRPRVTPVPVHRPTVAPRPVRHAARTETARPSTAPVLNWPIAREATYYRVRVYRVTGQFLFEVWSDETRLTVPATWRTGSKQNRLSPGRYGWAVYPAFGDLGQPSDEPAARQPLAGGHFTV